jgi:hypothetical protein
LRNDTELLAQNLLFVESDRAAERRGANEELANSVALARPAKRSSSQKFWRSAGDSLGCDSSGTGVNMAHSDQEPLRTDETGKGPSWNTTLVFVALIALTLVMLLFVKLVVSGSPHA